MDRLCVAPHPREAIPGAPSRAELLGYLSDWRLPGALAPSIRNLNSSTVSCNKGAKGKTGKVSIMCL